jgi:adenosylmethionine-8-amino-7-oxononanoate aminotransferase
MDPEHLSRLDKTFVWHPFTQQKDWENHEITMIEEGDGVFLKDVKGRRYIDGVSSLWCNIHGHRKREIDEAIRDQLDKIAHSTFLGLSNVPAVLLAEKLIGIAPKGLSRVFYSDSGSEAVEVALKMAFQYWQHRGRKGKTKFVKLSDAYHGDTVGSVSVGGIELFHEIYKPLLFETIEAPAPHPYRWPTSDNPHQGER